MTAYTAPVPHRAALPTRTQARTKIIPHVRNRIGALIAGAGLLLALVSLYLPWLTTGSWRSITALGITEIIDVRSIAPVLFLGLVLLLFLVAVTALTRLGAFAAAASVVALLVLAGHLAFVWTLYVSTGTPDPALSGLPADASVTFGPYVAALGFVMVAAGSVWAAKAADYVLPDVLSPLTHRDH